MSRKDEKDTLAHGKRIIGKDDERLAMGSYGVRNPHELRKSTEKKSPPTEDKDE